MITIFAIWYFFSIFVAIKAFENNKPSVDWPARAGVIFISIIWPLTYTLRNLCLMIKALVSNK